MLFQEPFGDITTGSEPWSVGCWWPVSATLGFYSSDTNDSFKEQQGGKWIWGVYSFDQPFVVRVSDRYCEESKNLGRIILYAKI